MSLYCRSCGADLRTIGPYCTDCQGQKSVKPPISVVITSPEPTTPATSKGTWIPGIVYDEAFDGRVN